MDDDAFLRLIEGLPFPVVACAPGGAILAASPLAEPHLEAAGGASSLASIVARAKDASADGLREPLHRTSGKHPVHAVLVRTRPGPPLVLVLFESPTALDPAAERARMVAALVPGVAHEVRGPLSSLSGMAQLLTIDPRLDPELRAPLGMVQAQVSRVDNLLRNLVSFVRGPLGGPELPGSVTDVLDRALSLLAHELRARHIAVARSEEGHLPLLGADSEELLLALVALVQGLVAGGAANDGSLRIVASGAAPRRLELAFYVPRPAPLCVAAETLLARLGATVEIETEGGGVVVRVRVPVWKDSEEDERNDWG